MNNTTEQRLSRLALLGLVSAVCLAVPASAQNLITNGDFDTEVPSAGFGSGWIASNIDYAGGWFIDGGDPGPYYVLNAGGQGESDPQIEQTITGLSPGGHYELSGSFQSVYQNHHPADACCSFQVEFDGVVVFESGPGPLGEWRPFGAIVIPSSAAATFKLRAEALGSDNDFAVDSVWLQETSFCDSPADLNGDGFLDNGDIIAFINYIFAGDPRADMNGDGINDNGDINTFVSLFLAGCP